LIEGDAPRGLDRFRTMPNIDGITVDTRTLYCGPPYVAPPATPTLVATVAPPPLGAPTFTATAPAAAEPTSTATPQVETFDECDRVSADAE
jgi:hypothetical protein